MNWKNIKLPAGSKLLKVHNFTFMYQGSYYSIEIDEFNDNTFTGHGEHSTDKNYVIESVSASTLEGCLEALVNKIQNRSA